MLDIATLPAWVKFIGGIAVVVSLIYLAGEIRQNSASRFTACVPNARMAAPGGERDAEISFRGRLHHRR
jgi:hypothetical protein